jgi:hypothetical protein
METKTISGLHEASFWFFVGSSKYHVQFKSFSDEWIAYVMHVKSDSFEQCLGGLEASPENITVGYALKSLQYFLNRQSLSSDRIV